MSLSLSLCLALARISDLSLRSHHAVSFCFWKEKVNRRWIALSKRSRRWSSVVATVWQFGCYCFMPRVGMSDSFAKTPFSFLVLVWLCLHVVQSKFCWLPYSRKITLGWRFGLLNLWKQYVPRCLKYPLLRLTCEETGWLLWSTEEGAIPCPHDVWFGVVVNSIFMGHPPFAMVVQLVNSEILSI